MDEGVAEAVAAAFPTPVQLFQSRAMAGDAAGAFLRARVPAVAVAPHLNHAVLRCCEQVLFGGNWRCAVGTSELPIDLT